MARKAKPLFNEVDMQFQIDHMVAFIDQEAREKIYEIEGKSEEEYNIEKGNLIQKERIKIREHYQRKEESVKLNKSVQNYSLLNKARLDLLTYRDTQICSLLSIAAEQMIDDVQSIDDYKPILAKLILQAILKALETRVLVRCIERDIDLVEECFPEASSKFKELTGKEITLAIDLDHFLPDDEIGGVEVISLNGHVKVITTLRSRLDKIFEELLPEIRMALLGPNIHRKFVE